MDEVRSNLQTQGALLANGRLATKLLMMNLVRFRRAIEIHLASWFVDAQIGVLSFYASVDISQRGSKFRMFNQMSFTSLPGYSCASHWP